MQVRMPGLDAGPAAHGGGPGLRGALRPGGDAGAAARERGSPRPRWRRPAGVSRQPVRDAFWRLSQLGFLTIRPQRATEVSADLGAGGAAGALRPHRARDRDGAGRGRAASAATELAGLDALLAEQAAAVAAGDRERFHALDDEFHRRICALGGHRVRLGADPREQGAHGPGAVPEPELRRAGGARRPPWRSWRRSGPATPRRRSPRCGCISAGSRTSWRGSG